MGAMRRLSVTLSCVAFSLGVPPALAQEAAPITRDEYIGALNATAGSMTADIERAHVCMVRSAFYSRLFRSDEGEEIDRVNQRLYATVADAFRARINTLIAGGGRTPDAFNWVAGAFYDNQPEALEQGLEWFRQDSAAEDFDDQAQACAVEVFNAAGQTNMEVFQRRALMTTELQ